MSAGTRLFLLLGCLVVIALEAPAALASLAAGWRGPYARPALALVPPAPVLEHELAQPFSPRTPFALLADPRNPFARR